MSISRESVAAVAQSLGYTSLSGAAASALAPELEQRMRFVIQEAVSIARHSRRSRLTRDDIKHALRVLNLSPAIGVPATPQKYETVAPGLHVVEDPVLSIDEILATPPPSAPLAPSFSSHWLAIDGTQPRIPQNPTGPVAPLPETLRPTGRSGAGAGAGTGVGVSGGGGGSGRAAAAGTAVVITDPKPLLTHVLSRELQSYFDKVVSLIQTPGNAEERRKALMCIETDAGLQQLVPYFSQYILAEFKTQTTLRNFAVVESLLALFNALLQNPALELELYIHQLLAAGLTVVVTKYIGASPKVDHWRLRRRAARLVAAVVGKYGGMYPHLQPRVLQTYTSALRSTPPKPLVSQFGAITGIACLGRASFCTALLPECSRIEKELRSSYTKAHNASLQKFVPKTKAKDGDGDGTDLAAATAAGGAAAGAGQHSSKKPRGKGKRPPARKSAVGEEGEDGAGGVDGDGDVEIEEDEEREAAGEGGAGEKMEDDKGGEEDEDDEEERARQEEAARAARAQARITAMEASMCSDALLHAVGRNVYNPTTPPDGKLMAHMFDVFGERIMPYVSLLPRFRVQETFL